MTRPAPPRAPLHPALGGGDHRRQAALHVLGAAAVEASVAALRHEGRRACRRRPRCRCDRRAAASAPVSNRRRRRRHSAGLAPPPATRRRTLPAAGSRPASPAIAPSPAAPGTSDGLTESIATSSRVIVSGSIGVRKVYPHGRARRSLSIRRMRRCTQMRGDRQPAAKWPGYSSKHSKPKRNLWNLCHLRTDSPRNPVESA